MNAGVANPGFFSNMENKKLQDMLDTNCYQVGAIMQKMTAKLDQRKGKRSGIISVSSIAGNFAVKGNIVYSASKAFVKYLCQSVDYENKISGRPVDILCL